MYPKIDIYIGGIYVCSTCASPDLKTAKEKFEKDPRWMGQEGDKIGVISIEDWKKTHPYHSTQVTTKWAEK